MIFLKHVEYRLRSEGELQSILAHVRDTAARVSGVRLRDFFILQGRNEFILVMESPDQATYQEWRALCPPPSSARDWVESAVLPTEFSGLSKAEESSIPDDR